MELQTAHYGLRVVEGTEVTVEGGEVRAAEQGPRRSRWGARPLGNWETRISLCFCKTSGRNGREFSKKAAEGKEAQISTAYSHFCEAW